MTPRSDRVVHAEHVWGTVVSIHVAGVGNREQAARSAVDTVVRWLHEVDEAFSTFKPDSLVSRYRSGRLTPGMATADFEHVLAACRTVRDTTRGAFDPWSAPGGYDPSGYVKGWAAGRAGELLSEAGFDDHLVNAGGDVWASGDEHPGTGAGWPVGILNPHDTTEIIEVVPLRTESLATSGRYERGDHVIDPASGQASTGVDSASVVGPDAGLADAYATAALVQGRDCLTWFSGLGGAWSLHLVIGDTAFTRGPAFADH